MEYFGYNNDMARPPKDIADRKNSDLRIPVTGDQKDAILKAVALDGMDMATWARAILLREAQRRIRKNAPG